jgi:hypothetical protein
MLFLTAGSQGSPGFMKSAEPADVETAGNQGSP